MNAEKPLAVVLLSGGMDSCVSAAIARETHRVALMHASYGQRTEKRERQAFAQIADFWGIQDRMVVRLDHLAQMGGSALTDRNIPVPQGRLDHSQVPITYVPFRNTHLLSAAVSWAEVNHACAVFIGAVHEDGSGYPDCRPEFYAKFAELVCLGTRPGTRIDVQTPVIGMRKAEIIARGIALGAPLHLTWSCYQNEEKACGSCESCLLRLRAFAEAGHEDPLPYQML